MTNTEALELKNMGNLEYKRGNYESALEYYTKAIGIDGNVSIYYSNKAMCYMRLGRIKEAMNDAQSAIELDNNNIKAHLLMGICICEEVKSNLNLKRLDTAVKRMKKAFSLCSSQNKRALEESIQNSIYRAEKLRFYILKDDYEKEAKLKYKVFVVG